MLFGENNCLLRVRLQELVSEKQSAGVAAKQAICAEVSCLTLVLGHHLQHLQE